MVKHFVSPTIINKFCIVLYVLAGRGNRLSDFLFLTIANTYSTTFFRCIYVKKVMKLVAFISEHPSYRFAEEKHCHAYVFFKFSC